MNPEYLWLTGALQLLSFFVIGPILAMAIAYAAWRGKLQSFKSERYVMVWVACGVAAVLLFVCAKRINADVRQTQYFFQLACMLLSGLLFGVSMGCCGVVISRLWLWHKATRLTDDSQT
jgi:undecaprenyl pyrophosphate phosphatase UppP